MSRIVVPLWLIIAIVCLSPFGEGLYAPSLPNITLSLKITENTAEHTMTFFLVGFAIGICFWGMISDRIGRRQTLIISLGLYVLGCIGCLLSETITSLMMCRFVQALGGSACTGIGQAIARDVYGSMARNRLFSIAGIAVSLAAGIGPIMGGIMVEHYRWSSIFGILLIASFSLWGYIILSLQETNPFLKRTSNPYTLKQGFGTLLKDKALLNLVILMGTANGLIYCFYSEGSFFLIESLGLKPSQYGWLYFIVCLGYTGGSLYSKGLHERGLSYQRILNRACIVLLGSTIPWAFLTVSGFINLHHPTESIILSTIFLTGSFFSIGIMIPNALANALENYREHAGTMASVFCSSYFLIAAFINFMISVLHNGTLLVMPLYYTALAMIVWSVHQNNLDNTYASLETDSSQSKAS
ncbi:multidrug effflux MFS transporter [Candidatus Finniella inopinata]|uniref:Bcr/CflA family efflux transporter n=1 Tax=Candidatus Finniella inopinata TaxID=1696036 RepID=A0A4Q7DGZ9_9PROT|nr:multidrug effflux MFS transporter [Candidatus Finniella inopinata]RZI46191.1 Bcr/CflA family efflux MFS transporter [Candidatus Finniella inopinata]